MNPHFIPLLAAMAPEGLLLLRVLGALAFVILIPVGFMLFKNQDRWFGHTAEIPTETSGSLGYGRAQAWLLYIGAVHLALFLALGL
ncbi:hypothetical protein [Brevifollis gellanilyticus]|uniref:DUF4149 domain-containing protein n=1 Tax=Brevifollis gellanilyticus TaxID=748831 RepID=A0A512M8N1_9BACT|nr:hypothetical protein [Brevifollis gellanilyticus]GEP42721.1 hypothetical protein BGE01nite_20120 [Brevifollis gellanilyticus]